jgi:fructose-1,6-bisphosphatase I
MFELAPVAMLFEKAGGASSDGEHSLLDTPIMNVSQTSQVFYGSKDEVKKCEERLGKKLFAPGEYERKYERMEEDRTAK